MALYPTKNSLQEKVRIEIVNEIQKCLALAIDFALQTKQAHWNVKGPDFIALHKLFDEIHGDAEEYADLIAERIVQLGGIAEGTIQAVSKKSELHEYPLTQMTGKRHVETLAKTLANFGEYARNMIDRTDELGDKDTADIFTEISRGSDKWLWMLESHFQTEA